jgi:hypothetical protein
MTAWVLLPGWRGEGRVGIAIICKQRSPKRFTLSECDYRLDIFDHFQIVTTSNYSSIVNSYTHQFTIAHTKSSQFVLNSRCLVTDPNKLNLEFCLLGYNNAWSVEN